MINEQRLFKLIPNFFSRPEGVLIEIAQNAHRAKATKLDITIGEGMLSAQDNGRGATHSEPLFVLADSNWDPETEATHMPAGWGIFYVISVSKEITFKSLFGSVTVDCTKFLEDKEYRESVIGRVNRADTAPGFLMKATLKDGVTITDDKADLSHFPMDISMNGEPIEKAAIQEEHDYILKTTYDGNFLGITKHIYESRMLEDTPFGSNAKIKAIWYGIPILRNVSRHLDFETEAVIDVTQGSPLTPVLPYRERLKQDDKLHKLLAFIKDTAVDMAIAYVNDPANTNHTQLVKRMSFLAQNATQEQLDTLTRFYYEQEEPYHDNHYCSEIIINPGTPVVSQSLELQINGEIQELDPHNPGVFLPEGTLTTRQLPQRAPKWAHVSQHTVTIMVQTKANGRKLKSYSDNWKWQKANIQCSEDDITTIAMIPGWGDGTIYYRSDPEDFVSQDLSEVVFEHILNNDSDSDTYDTQREAFDKQIREDIMNIKRKYSMSDLFASLSIAGLNPYEIKGIQWQAGQSRVTITTANGKRLLPILS